MVVAEDPVCQSENRRWHERLDTRSPLTWTVLGNVAIFHPPPLPEGREDVGGGVPRSARRSIPRDWSQGTQSYDQFVK